MENLSNLKIEIRKRLLEKRKEISPTRRAEAAQKALEALKDRGTILSFSPMGSEIDLTLLNDYLKSKGRLHLVPYKIDALITVPIESIDVILVPALGFDNRKHRIGYGKGYYDRFLKDVQIPTIGVGFKEQLYESSLPIEEWDVPVSELLLF